MYLLISIYMFYLMKIEKNHDVKVSDATYIFWNSSTYIEFCLFCRTVNSLSPSKSVLGDDRVDQM